MEALQYENEVLRKKVQQLEHDLRVAQERQNVNGLAAEISQTDCTSPRHDVEARGEVATSTQEGKTAIAAGLGTVQGLCITAKACEQEGRTFISNHSLSKAQVERYSRQLLLPAFGVAAQDKLCTSSVLVVGCGGLGSPSALYLAAAGMGRIGLVDHDTVDLTNLHRQVIHSERTLGHHKAESAAAACRALNSSITIETHTSGLHPSNAVRIISQYDVVIDASDNPATRYLINDACVACNKPLVSAAAVGTDGQLTIYNHGPEGPCYRCLFPVAPNPENCSKCSEAGVLGPVPGVLGTLQALEAIKLATGVGQPLSRQLLLYDGLSTRFMSVKLRSKVPTCAACGSEPSITRESIAGYDYAAFTGQPAHDGPMQPLTVLQPQQRISPAQLQEKLQLQQQQQPKQKQNAAKNQSSNQQQQQEKEQQQQVGRQDGRGLEEEQQRQQGKELGEGICANGASFLLLDVRPAEQFAVMSLPGAVNIAYDDKFDQQLPQVIAAAGGGAAEGARLAGVDGSHITPPADSEGEAAGLLNVTQVKPVVVMCRRGNHSQLAVEKLRALGLKDVVDVAGGYKAWVRDVDSSMPLL
jgi:adenylyltransferase/sulfurtransferase